MQGRTQHYNSRILVNFLMTDIFCVALFKPVLWREPACRPVRLHRNVACTCCSSYRIGTGAEHSMEPNVFWKDLILVEAQSLVLKSWEMESPCHWCLFLPSWTPLSETAVLVLLTELAVSPLHYYIPISFLSFNFSIYFFGGLPICFVFGLA
jgi:hypothetical protein